MRRQWTDPQNDLAYIGAVLVEGGAPAEAREALDRLRDAVDVARAVTAAVERRLARSQRAALTLREAARRLGVRRSSLAELVVSGKVHAVRIGRGTRIPATEVERLADQGLHEAGGRPRRRNEPVRPPAPGVGARILALRRGR